MTFERSTVTSCLNPIAFDDDDPCLIRVRKIALALPDTTEVVARGRPTFRCGKMFGTYGGSLKGSKVRHDQSILFIPDDIEHQALQEDPRLFLPAYLGAYGWLGLLLEPKMDWTEVGELLDASYRQIAPKRSTAHSTRGRAPKTRQPARGVRFSMRPASWRGSGQ